MILPTQKNPSVRKMACRVGQHASCVLQKAITLHASEPEAAASQAGVQLVPATHREGESAKARREGNIRLAPTTADSMTSLKTPSANGLTTGYPSPCADTTHGD